MKEEALKLAEIFEDVNRAKYPYYLDAADMIRRLVEELDKQKPLSDEEIEIMASAFIERATSTQRQECIEFARAIEERHGIK